MNADGFCVPSAFIGAGTRATAWVRRLRFPCSKRPQQTTALVQSSVFKRTGRSIARREPATHTRTMSAIYPRRTERIKLRRNVQLVFRTPRGRVDSMPAATFAVSCHGAGLYAMNHHLQGSEVFLLDSRSGVGAWGKLVWEGEQLHDGRIPVGVEFSKPGNHWHTRLVPRSWLPFLGRRGGPPRPYLHEPTERIVLVGARVPEKLAAPIPPGEACRCCGCREEVIVDGQEPVCKVCRDWVA